MTLTVEQAIQQAIDEHKAGNLQQAEHLYRAILQVQPKHPDANHNMGVLALSVGKPSEAIPFFRAALDSFPDQPQFWISLIEYYLLIGDHESAQTTLSQARCKGFHDERFDKLEVRFPGCQEEYATPEKPKPHLRLAERRRRELVKKREKKNASSSTATKLPVSGPSQEQIDRAIRLYNTGMLNETEHVSIELTQKFPSHPFAWKLLGAVLHITGRKEAALAPMMKAARLSQRDAEAHSNLGNALKDLGRLKEAEASCREAIRIKPDYGEAHINLGNALKGLGRLEEAVVSYQEAIRIKPDFAEAHNNLGVALIDFGRLEEAEASCREAIRIKPDYAEAHNNLGNALKDLGRLKEAEASCREAIRIKPDYAEAYINLGNSLIDFGRLEEAEARCREAIRIKPDYAEARSNLLFLLSCFERTSRIDYLNEAKRFGQLVTEKARTKFSHWPLEYHPARLRVGFVSGDLRNHPVGYFIEGLCNNLSPDRIELIAFSTKQGEDELTARLKPFFREWHSIFGMADEQASRAIHDARINVLIDLAGHSANNRLGVFAYKPAPIQVSWLGYWASTGVEEMDYVLVDSISAPESAQEHFTESVWRLPDTRLCFTPPRENPRLSITPPPSQSDGIITFGCFQNPAKLNDAVLAAWGKIFNALPTARLRLQNKQLSNAAMREQLQERLAVAGIAPERVTFSRAMSRENYLASYAQVDMILDTFPYPGGTTTCEGLWMGVPTITLTGDTVLARQGAGLLTCAGLEDWIANDENEYVAKALAYAGDSNRLSKLRMGLRARMLASPLCDAPRFARNFEAALWSMWCVFRLI